MFTAVPLKSLFRRGATLSLALTISGVAACTPIVDKRGYVPDAERIQSVQIGVDNKESVYQRLGSPSTTASFGSEVWYYVSTRHERFAFFAPEVTEREVVAVAFDDVNMVSDIGHYGLEDGKVVTYVARITPTRGKEMTFLEQVFGNLGRLPAPGGENGK